MRIEDDAGASVKTVVWWPGSAFWLGHTKREHDASPSPAAGLEPPKFRSELNSRAVSSRLAGLFAGLTLLAGMSPVVAPEPALASSRVPAAGTPLPAGRQLKLLDLGQESVGAMMARERQAGPRGTPTALPPRLPANLGNLRPNPASRRLTATPDPQPASGTLSPRAAQTVGTQLLGATRADSPFIPPDTSGAVGPSQFIVMVNGRIRSFNKTTGAADGGIDMTTDTFWSPAGSTSDPRIRYDRLSGRWFVSMITVTTVGTANYVLSAYSDTNTITGGTFWRKVAYVVDTFHAGCLWDFDTLGIDQNALYIGGGLICR